MLTFHFNQERPKSIAQITWRIPEEAKAYVESRAEYENARRDPRTQKAITTSEKGKDLIEKGMKAELLERLLTKVDPYTLSRLVSFFEEKPCSAYCLNVLPLSDPQTQFLKNGGFL